MEEISIISNIYLFTNKHTNEHSFHDRNLIRREKRKKNQNSYPLRNDQLKPRAKI